MITMRHTVERAIGEHLAGTQLEDLNEGKNPHAVALGRLWGQKGGKARAKKFSREKRRKIATLAANKRLAWKVGIALWHNPEPTVGGVNL